VALLHKSVVTMKGFEAFSFLKIPQEQLFYDDFFSETVDVTEFIYATMPI
jgi:hypothetical protein